MKAIVIHNYGPPDVLKYETVPDPEPRAGEVRIRIHAATVNRVLDVSLRAGKEGARSPVLPLILGVGDREMFVASDLSALVRHTTSVVHLDDGELATVTASEFRTFSRDEENTAKIPTAIDVDLEDVGLAGHRHYMRKEILEQPSTIERMLRMTATHERFLTLPDPAAVSP